MFTYIYFSFILIYLFVGKGLPLEVDDGPSRGFTTREGESEALVGGGAVSALGPRDLVLAAAVVLVAVPVLLTDGRHLVAGEGADGGQVVARTVGVLLPVGVLRRDLRGREGAQVVVEGAHLALAVLRRPHASALGEEDRYEDDD